MNENEILNGVEEVTPTDDNLIQSEEPANAIENEQPVAESAQTNEDPIEAEIFDEQVEEDTPINDRSEYASYGRYRTAMPEIEMTVIDKPDGENKMGLRVFAFVLAAVILLCAGLTAGYFFGRGSVKSGTGMGSASVDLAAKPASGDMMTAGQVYEEVNDSIVGIAVYNDSSMSSASGVVYTEDGYIITNDHIYDGIAGARFMVYTADGNEYSAEYVAGDTRSDVAVIKISESEKLKPAVFGNPDELYIGEPVVAIGRPTGAQTANNLTGGYVSFVGRRAGTTSNYSMPYIQTDSAINPGSSGGALLNMYGQVVGITSSKIAGSEYEGMGFAIPMTTVKQVAESLISKGYVEGRAKLGISYTEIDSIYSEVYDMQKGLRVASVDAESDLYGKVSEGDIIIAVNGKDITSADVILDEIANSLPGDKIEITVVGDKGESKVSATLLADKGSSSYSIQGTENEIVSGGNTSDFNFPFGD